MRKPNIIFILSDDQGSWATGCSGNAEIITPHIDFLAKNGMYFENFFCVSPVCSPARASLFTGKIPSQHGIHDWLKESDSDRDEIEYLKNHKTFVEVLAKNGYICGLSGKWHLGNNRVPKKGFSFWYAHKKGGGPYYGAPMYKNDVLTSEERYITDAITDEALDFLDAQNGEKPFFLNIGYTAPHSPWKNCHPKRYTDMYESCKFESLPKLSPHPCLVSSAGDVLSDIRANQIGYYAAVTAMDENIGRILAKIKEKKCEKDTVVIFTSDNGFNFGHHGCWGKGNATFPINMYDTSVKVPFIISHPGHIPENSRVNALISAYDLMPTLLEYSGCSYEQTKDLPGKSFAASLVSNKFEKDEPVVVFDEYGPNRMIRTRKHKYVKRFPYGPDELFDLEKDPDENTNLIAECAYSDVLSSLKETLGNWFFRYVDPTIDGAREAVWGSGQINLAGKNACGENSYWCDDYIKASSQYKKLYDTAVLKK